ncbi:MAG: hypothetical protein ABF479_09930 [Gluconacetobacter sp.]|uniref:Uncharacterized protein n=1 Tax=Gluconacetobacter dulcium TaxID=2729096 RepID=A0A7W4JZ11_9PROT|nr:hypothetical protein [Gluconacetobacter dulcium]MBB2197314.1 hypothetical protein [Gluconacetobacter dulcium]
MTAAIVLHGAVAVDGSSGRARDVRSLREGKSGDRQVALFCVGWLFPSRTKDIRHAAV